jgi:N-glycosidase YbiA
MEAEGPVIIVCEPWGPFGALSNFAHIPVCIQGVTWPSVEHYFQAEKFTDASSRDRIRVAASPQDAKAMAWSDAFKGRVIANWDERRLHAMRRALTAKFDQSEVARNALLSTWPLPIVELSDQDLFWGKNRSGVGLNWLGKLLCEVRSKLRFGRAGFSLLEQAIHDTEGRSDFSLAGIRVEDAEEECGSPALAYPAFAELEISAMVAVGHSSTSTPTPRPSSSSLPSLLDLRARALDKKYARYSWFQDARSAVGDWVARFRGVLCVAADFSLNDAKILTIGAGSANEATMVWSQFGKRSTLVDLGFELSENCAREAPLARVIRSPAESLEGIGSSEFDVYCALRTYDAADLDVRAALAEAHRVLRPGGLVFLTISNGYLAADGSLIHGQIGETGQVERYRPWKLCVELLRLTRHQGFAGHRIFDLRSEIGFYAYRAS